MVLKQKVALLEYFFDFIQKIQKRSHTLSSELKPPSKGKATPPIISFSYPPSSSSRSLRPDSLIRELVPQTILLTPHINSFTISLFGLAKSLFSGPTSFFS